MTETKLINQGDAREVELKKKEASKKRSITTKRVWTRGILLIGIVAHLSTMRSWSITGSFLFSALGYIAVLKAVNSFPAFSRDEQSKLLGKRVMSLLSSAVLGLASLYSTVTGGLLETTVGMHAGVYLVDSWSFTDSQLSINALIFHHISLYCSALLLIHLGALSALVLIAFQELSNPFWYGHMILKLHQRAPESTLVYSRFATLFAYLFVRFSYGLPAYLRLQWVDMFQQFSLLSLFHWFNISAFVGISANNIMKVCRS